MLLTKQQTMRHQEKNVVGLWLDHKHAFIIRTADRKIGGTYEMVKKIDREVHTDENYKNEQFELAKNNAEIKKYFKAITDEIVQDHVIFIFGPGKAQEEFKNVLKDILTFKNKEIAVGKSDKLSINQMIARVVAHFGSGTD